MCDGSCSITETQLGSIDASVLTHGIHDRYIESICIRDYVHRLHIRTSIELWDLIDDHTMVFLLADVLNRVSGFAKYLSSRMQIR
jgi:hypothetical protein